MKAFLLASFLICEEFASIGCDSTTQNDHFTCFNNGICLSENYDINKIPSKPINIDVTISIVQINEIDDLKSTVDIIAWMTYEWEDIHVVSRNVTTSMDRGYISGLLDNSWLRKLWIPNIYYYRLKGISLTESLGSSVGEFFVLGGWIRKLLSPLY